jgi:putative Holliday junction resolvase
LSGPIEGSCAFAPFLEARAFGSVLPLTGSLLSLDASRKRLGLAGTDPHRRVVTPLVTMLRANPAREEEGLRRLLLDRKVAGLVLGYPLNMDGTEGPMARAARSFGRRLGLRFGLPVLLQDERLTSFAVAEAIEEKRLKRPRKGEPVDHYAAAVILEDALRALRA